MRVRHKVRVEVQQITPALARKWIEKNKNNRPLNENQVLDFAAAMEAGEWALNGDAIRFDRDGNVSDGQHRLHAVVLSGATIETVVIRDLEPVAFDTIDCGRKRSKGDVLARHGESNYATLSGALAWLWRYENNKLLDSGPSSRPRVQQVLAYLRQHPKLRESVDFIRGEQLQKLTGGSLMAFAHYVASRRNKAKADEFFHKLGSGEGIHRSNAVYKLREKLLANRASKERKARAVYVAAWTAKAWKASLNGDDLKKLSWAENEAFPSFS